MSRLTQFILQKAEMKLYVSSILVSLLWKAALISAVTPEDYMIERQQILDKEMEQMIGSALVLTAEEEQLNKILMREKFAELTRGQQSELDYPPSINFILAKKDIEASMVFQILKKLPKGASLHSHAFSSIDWLVGELSYSDDIYMCQLTERRIIFKYQNSSKQECNWENLSDVRSKLGNQNVDDMLKKQMTIITDDPRGDYPTINDVWIKLQENYETTKSLIYASVDFYQRHLWQTLQEQVDDGISYIEFRAIIDPMTSSSGEPQFSVEQMIGLSAKVVNNFTTENVDNFYGAKLIYSQSRRHQTNEGLKEDLRIISDWKRSYPEFIAAFDLVGPEDLGKPLKHFVNTFLSHEEPLKLLFHAGETNWHGLDTDENILDALLLNTSRIGHAFAITKHPELLKIVKERDVALEICPIAHQVLHLVDDLRNHPAAVLAAQNFSLVIAPDGYQMWGGLPLSHDFYETFHAIGGARADLRFVKQLIINSIRYSVLSTTEQEELMSMWELKWQTAISQLIEEFN